MNALRTIVCASLVPTMFGPVASAADAGPCNYSVADRVTWVDSLSRQLRNHDPAHSAQMSKVASEIVNGRVDELKTDISAGLDPNATLALTAKPVGYMSLLTLAVAACQTSVAQELVASGASVDGAGGASTPLVTAAAKGNAAMTEFLIQRGATVDKVDENGHTALEDAVRQRQLNTVKTLLTHGGNPNRVLGGGGTILDLVSHSSDRTDQAIAKELRAHAAGNALTQAVEPK